MADAPQPLPATSTAPLPAPPVPPADAGQPPKPNSTMGETNGASSGTPIADLASASATNIRPGGAPAREYLNDKIVPHLLEGMKSVAREQPANPLRVLGEFLIQKSNEVEGGAKKESEASALKLVWKPKKASPAQGRYD